MNKSTVVEFNRPAEANDPLMELLRSGARQLIQQAVESELQAFLAHYADRVTDEGYAGVVRNGYLPERPLQTGIGPVTVKIPKVRSRTGEPVTFQVSTGTPVCAQDAFTGSGITLVVPERYFHW